MLSWIKNWVREIVKEEIRQSYYTTSDYSRWAEANDSAVKDFQNSVFNNKHETTPLFIPGEIIKLNETAQFLKENEDKEISIGEILKDDDKNY